MIKAIYEAGLAQFFYDLMMVISLIGVAVYAAVFSKKYAIKPLKAVFFVAIVYGLSHLLNLTLAFLANGSDVWGITNIVRIFVYIPLVAWPISKIFKINWSKMCDFIAPCPALVQGIAHWGCIFTGCCYGYPSKFGIYHPLYQITVFPQPMLEASVALVIAFTIIFLSKKRNYNFNGMAYPLMMVMFGGTRFFLEFLRDNTKIFYGISALAFHALFCFAIGALVLIYRILRRKKTGV